MPDRRKIFRIRYGKLFPKMQNNWHTETVRQCTEPVRQEIRNVLILRILFGQRQIGFESGKDAALQRVENRIRVGIRRDEQEPS